jgi:glycosyltransferase involved in cell wall biosynthesis
LKSRKYDVIWTQWPDLEGYAPQFWTMCRMSGLKLVHTVHNVLPHERFAGDRECYAKAYRAARLLFVHSEHSRKMLAENFTFAASRVVLMHHGLYTIYPRRTEARQAVRKRLGIEDSQTMLLCCGSIRPYKNVSATIEAMKDPRCAGTVLVISGMEQEEGSDPLEHTRSDVERAGVADRVRLLPGLKPREEMAELFEACDVLMLPYLESYSSGLLLLGMTFGKHIVMTRTGGAEESLALYKEHTLLEGTSADCIAAGIARADYRIRNCPAQTLVTPELDWRQIAKTAMNDIEERVLRPRS